jgi:alpha-galactosidase
MLLERRRAAVLAAVLHNDSTQALTVRRILMADPSATRVPAPSPPERLAFLVAPASTRDTARIVPGDAGPLPPASGFTAAADPATGWTLLAGFPCARIGNSILTWTPNPGGAPGLGLGAVVETGPVRLGPDERLAADELLILCEADAQAALEAFALLARETATGRHPASAAAREPLAAWGTGLAFRGDLGEDNLTRNLDFIARHLRAAGLGMVLIEDGFQRAAGDWETHARLPRGHRWITGQTRERGLRAGLAIAPLDVSEQSPLFAARPSWLAREASGPGGWRLDPSIPDARKWVADLAQRAATEWSYDAILLERLAPASPGRAGESPAHPAASDLRRLLESVRETLGPEHLLLAADAPPSALAGLADAVRVGPEAGPVWAEIQATARALAVAQAFNRPPGRFGAAGISLAPPLTDDEARTWASLIALTGGFLVLGDNLPLLPPPRAALLQRLLPPLPGGGRAVDLLDRPARDGTAPPPSIWHRPIAPGGETADLVLLVNWTEVPARPGVALARLGLPAGGTWIAYDTTEGERIEVREGRLEADIRPRASRLILLLRESPRPRVVATSRHLVPCAIDLERETWDAGTRTLVGRSRSLLTAVHRIPGSAEPGYALTVRVPPGLRLAGAAASTPCLAARAARDLIRIEFPEVTAETIDWTIRFAEAPDR